MFQKNALLSVYNKEGIVEFAQALVELGWTLYSSGGTAKKIADAKIPVQDVATLVGGEAILGHRVVTLSREVHGGLLARNIDIDIAELEKEGIPWIGLVCVDMYPLKEEIKKEGSTPESVIEKTDIGGPAMLRSAAKSRRITLCDANDRPRVIEWMKAGELNREEYLNYLAAKAEFAVANYCLSSAVYHGKGEYAGIVGERIITCKYGENAYQTPAALYATENDDPLALDKLKVISGTNLSFNNICDIDRLLQTITHIAATFDINRGAVPLIAVGVKHGNACGASIGNDSEDVVIEMITGDSLAIFGGLIMLNFPVSEEVAEAILQYGMLEGKRRLLDGIIAPSFEESTLEMLKRKGDKCRLVVHPALASLDRNSLDKTQRLRFVRGGFLMQPNYTFILDLNDPDLVKIGKATIMEENDMLLVKAIGDTSNSNTITLGRQGILIGNGVGQQARVYGAKLAVERAKSSDQSSKYAAASSDSFFPETDGVEVLAEAGVKAIISTSGSVRDKEVIEFCEEKGIILYLIPDKKGRGFFGH